MNTFITHTLYKINTSRVTYPSDAHWRWKPIAVLSHTHIYLTHHEELIQYTQKFLSFILNKNKQKSNNKRSKGWNMPVCKHGRLTWVMMNAFFSDKSLSSMLTKWYPGSRVSQWCQGQVGLPRRTNWWPWQWLGTVYRGLTDSGDSLGFSLWNSPFPVCHCCWDALKYFLWYIKFPHSCVGQNCCKFILIFNDSDCQKMIYWSCCLYAALNYIINMCKSLRRGNLGAWWESHCELGCQRVEWHNIEGQC